jgi:hypothetical protein
MKTITKEFEGIYGNGGPLGMGKNLNTKTMLNRIPNKQYQNNVSSYDDTNYSLNKPTEESSGFPYVLITLFIILIIIWVIYYFRNDIYNYFKNLAGKPTETKDTSKLEKDVATLKSQLEKNEREMNEKNNIKLQEEKDKKEQDDIKKGGVQQLDDKLNSVSAYKQEQLVKENSYCYIGTDNGQRECINAYAGDVCLSGQIFPKMEICINPRLRA